MFGKYPSQKKYTELSAVLLPEHEHEEKNSTAVKIHPEEAIQSEPLAQLEKILNQDIITNILEYTLHDFEGINQSPKFMKRIFQKDQGIAEIILLLDQIDRLEESLLPQATQRFKKGSIVLRASISLLILAGVVASIGFAHELNSAKSAASELLLQAEKFILQNCSKIQLSDFTDLGYSACAWTPEGVVKNFNCSQDLVERSNYAVSCANADAASGKFIGFCIGIVATIILSACFLYCLRRYSIYSKETGALSAKWIPEEQRQAFPALLDSENLNGLTIRDVKKGLQNNLRLAIIEWKKANPEAGFDTALPRLLDHSSENRPWRDGVMNAMIYGNSGYLARKGQLLFPKEPGEFKAAIHAESEETVAAKHG